MISNVGGTTPNPNDLIWQANSKKCDENEQETSCFFSLYNTVENILSVNSWENEQLCVLIDATTSSMQSMSNCNKYFSAIIV